MSNTTPLIGLAVIGHFDLLRQFFSQITISQAVYQEAVIFGRQQGGARREVSEANWIKIIAVKDRLAVDVLLDEMDLGEAETIVLARELGTDWVLMDEKKGRRKLVELGLEKIVWRRMPGFANITRRRNFNRSGGIPSTYGMYYSRKKLQSDLICS